jgi:RimJ/RimL family protein N-acetyltransferase
MWPLFGLRLTAGDLELRPPREADQFALAAGLPDDVEQDPDAPRAGFGDEGAARAAVALQWVWRCWGEWTPDRWVLPFAVRAGGELVGAQVLEGADFPVLRTVDSASWLAKDARGRGIGRRMRAVMLAFAFGRLGAEYAITSAWTGNGPSLGVSRALGYRPNGVSLERRPDVPGGAGEMVHLRLSRQEWEASRPGDVRVEGFEGCRPLFGVGDGAGA